MLERKRFSIDRLKEEFVLVDSKLTHPLDIHLIGGGAMGLANLKIATKDIDVIVRSHRDLKRLEAALSKAHYEAPENVDDSYREMGINAVFDKPGTPRWDIFLNVVCRRLRLSPGMMDRATLEETGTENLQVYKLHPSDIFVFKSITPRPDDRDDMAAIQASGFVDWQTILSEMRWQSDPARTVWTPTFVEALEDFSEDNGVVIPIIRELTDLAAMEAYQRILLDRAGREGMARDHLVDSIKEDPGWVNEIVDDLLKRELLVDTGRLILCAGPNVLFSD